MNKGVKPKEHGGDVWGFSRRYGVQPEKILDFSAPINPLGPSRKALEALRKNVEIIRFYPDKNPSTLKEAICQYVGGISPENIILGNGSMDLIYLFINVFASNGEILIPVPSFLEYERAAIISGAKPKLIGLYDEFSLNIEEIKQKLNEKTRLLIICNPHSPSGRLYDRELILNLIEFCNEKGCSVLVDENYIDFSDLHDNYTLAAYVNFYDNLFVVRSFSKFFGMPGIRLGYGIGSPKTLEQLEDYRQPWGVNSLAFFAAEAALKDRRYIEETRKLICVERERMVNMLKEISVLHVFPSQTNFLLLNILNGGISASDLKEKLALKGILIRDCSNFRNLGQSYFRVSVRKYDENLVLFKALKEAFNF